MGRQHNFINVDTRSSCYFMTTCFGHITVILKRSLVQQYVN